MSAPEQTDEGDEFVTIIGADMAEITNEFRTQGLGERQFTIVHRVGRHRFTVVAGAAAEPLFEGRQLMAATFARRGDA